ncbi:MAG: class I adenylate-forming enzyme family protein, partial [Desulfotignum sp.]
CQELASCVFLWIFTGPDDLCPDWAVPFEIFIQDQNGNLPPEIDAGPDDDAALYFTSGTTGNPKAVVITHKNLTHACEVENNHHSQTIDDIFLCIPPLYHTGAKMHWMGSFLVGGRCILLNGVSPEWILEAVSEERCTIAWLLVPWAHDILIAIDNQTLDLSHYQLHQWRLMHSGAQPVPPSLVKRWQHYFPHQDYDTNYGLTESTGPGCIHLGIENSHRIGPIGKAGHGWEAKIVDKQGNLLFGNETGELIVRGPGVMRAYYKNEAATQETLKDGWLHTGDMIIYGGENIYPNEIENFFLTHEKIKDIAVIGVPDERLGEIPAGIISVKPNCMICEKEILDFQQALPRYKRLRKIFFGDVPRNPTGKIEKPKLRRLYAEDNRKDLHKLLH